MFCVYLLSLLLAYSCISPSVHGLRRLWCPEIVDLVERMWAQDANDRPDMTEVVHELERLYKVHK